eukprot:scaffold260086_cov49-Attheya_sp.AAC.2
MFMKSAASDTLQGQAIQSINTRWGGDSRCWSGRESIGIPVCKKKYAPFSIKVKGKTGGGSNIVVERMYGCHCHSRIRQAVIEKHGERPGWEPFGQWSLGKARAMAKRLMDRMNNSEERDDSDTAEESSSDEERTNNGPWKSMCNNGLCAWKMRAKYDDVFSELRNKENVEKVQASGYSAKSSANTSRGEGQSKVICMVKP